MVLVLYLYTKGRHHLSSDFYIGFRNQMAGHLDMYISMSIGGYHEKGRKKLTALFASDLHSASTETL